VAFWEVEDTPQANANATRKILHAALFAAEKHSRQRRKGLAAEPYVNHAIEVAQLVASTLDRPDPDLIAAALLHDTVEDTEVTFDELTDLFGADTASLVAEVTDDKSLPKAERKRLQVANAPHKTVRAQTIKLADKISNLRSILKSPPADWSARRKAEYFDWARQVVNGLSSPNAALRAEFDRLFEAQGSPGAAPNS
jgi:(p)ppGpp synthase/HD superfamily hydrolase